MDSQAKIERGEEALARGELRAAIIDAKAVLQEEPDNLKARLLLGKASVIVGDGVAAEKELRRAIELGAAPNTVLVDLGRSLLQQGKFDAILSEISVDQANEGDKVAVMNIRADAFLGRNQSSNARELYSEVLEIDAANLDAQLGIARTFIADDEPDQAREMLDGIIAANPNFMPALQLSGVLGLQTRELLQASSHFERAAELARLAADPASELASLYGQAEAVFLLNKMDDVRRVLGLMQAIAPGDPRTMITAARIAVANGELSNAQDILQRILKQAPEFRPAQLLLGVVHKENGNLGQAEMHLSAFLATRPDNVRARMLLAETRLELNKDEEARQTLEPLTTGGVADIVALSMAAGAHLNLGEADEAIALLERSAVGDPDNANLKVQLALAYFRNRQFEEARDVLTSIRDVAGEINTFRRDALLVMTMFVEGEQSAALHEAKELRNRWPGRVEAHSLVGSIEMALNHYDDARSSFRRGLLISPNDVASLRYLAQLDMAEGNEVSAREKFRAVLDLQPDDEGSMMALARLAARAERFKESQEWLEKVRKVSPESLAARAILASYYLAFRDFAAAEEVATEAIKLSPNNARLYYLLGLAQLGIGKNRDAELSLTKAVELDPGDAKYRHELASTQAVRGNAASAIHTLTKSVDRTLRHLPSGLLLASLRARTGDMNGAFEVADRLRELHPGKGIPVALRAELFVKQGNLPAAIDAFDEALSLELIDQFAVRSYEVRRRAGVADQVAPLVEFLEAQPSATNVRIYLASAYESMGDSAAAIREYQEVLKGDPMNFVATNNLAWQYFTVGDSRAEALARRAYELRPDNGAGADTLGWILASKGNLEDGVKVLRKAVELSDGRAEVRYHLAAALARSGHELEAKAILEELVRSDVSFRDRAAAQDLLASLGS